MGSISNNTSIVRSFQTGGKFYSLILFFQDDDRIEVRDQDGAIHLTFSASSYVYKGDLTGECIGRIRLIDMDHGHWKFVPEIPTMKELDLISRSPEVVIDLEVLVAQAYLGR